MHLSKRSEDLASTSFFIFLAIFTFASLLFTITRLLFGIFSVILGVLESEKVAILSQCLLGSVNDTLFSILHGFFLLASPGFIVS
jgi:uncharacterized membrane protein